MSLCDIGVIFIGLYFVYRFVVYCKKEKERDFLVEKASLVEARNGRDNEKYITPFTLHNAGGGGNNWFRMEIREDGNLYLITVGGGKNPLHINNEGELILTI